MSILSDYRASIKRLIEAEDVEASAVAEGFGETVASILTKNKAFKASRSVMSEGRLKPADGPYDRMSHPKSRKTSGQ
jgi:hypothetical protein